VSTVLNGPGIERGAADELLASTEAVAWITPDEDSAAVGFVVRGVSPAGPAMRPGFRVIAGRLFRPGARELIVGTGARRVFGMGAGGKVVMPDGEWPIVGVYSAGGNISESDLMADADTLMSTMRRTSFNSVLVRLQSAAALEPFGQWLAANPGPGVTAERQGDYYVRTETGYNTRFFNAIAALVGLTMVVGALFGTVKVLYALVRARSREIAMLRAIGYEAVPVATAVLTQSVALCALGAALGAGLAWLVFDGKLTWYYNNIFTLSIPAGLIALAAGGAVAIAVLAGLPPAIRAARLPVAESLREAS
jgi:putative ABC transport system permease protein